MVGKERNESESRTAGERHASIKHIRRQITITKEWVECVQKKDMETVSNTMKTMPRSVLDYTNGKFEKRIFDRTIEIK